VLVGEESLLAEMGRIEQMEQELRTQKAALKKYMRDRS